MKAKKKPLERFTLEDLGLSEEDLEIRTSIQDQYLPPKKQAGKVLGVKRSDRFSDLVNSFAVKQKWSNYLVKEKEIK